MGNRVNLPQDAMEMLGDVESDEDESFVPPPVILESELDYDDYDPEEVNCLKIISD